MFFYCTTQVENYFKIGISKSYEGIKDRLSDYRSIYPWTKILFFTEVIHGEELERSFKNKFDMFRIGRSECYTLRSDIIFRHVLKFLHRQRYKQINRRDRFHKIQKFKNKELFGFWDTSSFHLSSYYFDGEKDGLLGLLEYKTKDFHFEDTRRNKEKEGYSFTEREIYSSQREDLFKIGTSSREVIKTDKEGKAEKYKTTLKYCDLSSEKKFKTFKANYNKFSVDYWGVKYRSERVDLESKFKKENFNKKKIFKDAWSHETFLRELTFDSLYKIRPALLKGYGLYPHKTSKHIFYGDADRSLNYSRKIKNTFKINVGINNYFESYFKKIMHYPKDKFLEHLNTYMDFHVDGHHIRSAFRDTKKIELMNRINRIIKKHHSEALKYIKKAYEEYENEK